MPVVSTMILHSLRLIGEKTRGATLTTDEGNECLSELNGMLDSWATERLMIHTLSQTSFALTASTGTYTIGTGATFNTPRPINIVDPCFTRDSTSTDISLTIIDAMTYGGLPSKGFGNTVPNYLFYDRGYSATSSATVYLYPLPTSGLTLFINSLQAFTNFSTLSHPLQLPPGYQRAIEYNYAIEAAGGYTEVDPSVAMIARESKANLKRLNTPKPTSKLDSGIATGMKMNILVGP